MAFCLYIRIRLYDLGPGSLKKIKTPHKLVRRKGCLPYRRTDSLQCRSYPMPELRSDRATGGRAVIGITGTIR